MNTLYKSLWVVAVGGCIACCASANTARLGSLGRDSTVITSLNSIVTSAQLSAAMTDVVTQAKALAGASGEVARAAAVIEAQAYAEGLMGTGTAANATAMLGTNAWVRIVDGTVYVYRVETNTNVIRVVSHSQDYNGPAGPFVLDPLYGNIWRGQVGEVIYLHGGIGEWFFQHIDPLIRKLWWAVDPVFILPQTLTVAGAGSEVGTVTIDWGLATNAYAIATLPEAQAAADGAAAAASAALAAAEAVTSADWIDPDYWTIGATPVYSSLGTPTTTQTVADVVYEIRTVAEQTVADYELSDAVRRGYPTGTRSWTFSPTGAVTWISADTVRFAENQRVDVTRTIGSKSKTIVLPPYTSAPTTATNTLEFAAGSFRRAVVDWAQTIEDRVAADTNELLSAYYWETAPHTIQAARVTNLVPNAACYLADFDGFRCVSPARAAGTDTRTIWHGTLISRWGVLQAWHANDGASKARSWVASDTNTTATATITKVYTPEEASLMRDYVIYQVGGGINYGAAWTNQATSGTNLYIRPPYFLPNNSVQTLPNYTANGSISGIPAWIVGQYRDVIPVKLRGNWSWGEPDMQALKARFYRPLESGDSGCPCFIIVPIDGVPRAILVGLATYQTSSSSATYPYGDEIAAELTSAISGDDGPTIVPLDDFLTLGEIAEGE